MKHLQSVARIEQDPRWQVLLTAGAAEVMAPGDFVYALRARGVYLRPGQGEGLPDPQDIEFFDSAEQAEAAGYRPAAAEPAGDCVARACRQIEQASSEPSLATLAAAAGLSPWQFHRLFRRVTGVTPKDYARAWRARRLRQGLEEGAAVTEALYDAGFGSSSRLYEDAAGLLGMRPGEYRQGGSGQRIRFAVGQCSLGAILVACSGKGVCAILLGDEPEPLVQQIQQRFGQAELVGADAEFEGWVAQVVGMIEAPGLGLQLPLDIRGSLFQQRVWQALRQIPPGTTASYQDIARQIGAPTASRAVAGACSANWLAVAIPCHRVVRADGGLSGYRWGVERKASLLRREREEIVSQVGAEHRELQRGG